MRIAIVCNSVAGGWSPLDDQGWSGGEETVVKFSEALARRGHSVYVVCDIPNSITPRADLDVNYCARGHEIPSGAFDIALYFKCPELADPKLAPRLYCWTDQERPLVPDPFDKVAACSQYLARVLTSLSPRVASRLTVLPYGIDVDEVRRAGVGVLRDPLEVLHCASPDRGLVDFLRLWPRVLAEVPDAHLTIAYGWDLFDKYGGPLVIKTAVQALLADLPESSYTMGRLSRDAMHQALHRAVAYAYYCTGGEQFGLTPLKARVAGCLPIVKPWGALHETVPAEFHVPDADAMVERLVNVLRHGHHATVVSPDLDAYDWDAIVTRWEAVWAESEPMATLDSPVTQVPGSPAFLAPVGHNVLQAMYPALQQWLSESGAQAPWIDPSLGYPPGPALSPETADAVVVGWALEDGEQAPGRMLRGLLARPGTPMLTIVSHGAWRAPARQRALTVGDLETIAGTCPEFRVMALPLDAEGNGATLAAFRYVAERVLDERDYGRVARLQVPRQTLSVCMMVRDAAHTLGMALNSIASVADEVVLIDTGSTDGTEAVAREWATRTGVPLMLEAGTSPRWCFDCLKEHGIGEMAYGHRVAGFETARNQSIALAHGDWILWLDADEEVVEPRNLHKYLRPNVYQGYGVPQHHFSMDAPEASKIDLPVRLFRRADDPTAQPRGWFPYGPEAWPTYGTGLTARFTGIVHEHPGLPPTYLEGLGPVIMLSDVRLAHRGYFVEQNRRGRFVRNWPLMCLDRLKYPERRLGRFLWIRDLSHQVRYLVECAGGQVTPEAVQLAQEGCELFAREFSGSSDAYCADAAMFATTCAQVLGRGVEFVVNIQARKPELTGEETVGTQFSGRYDDLEQVLQAIRTRMADVTRWVGPYA